jgi:hypothetical protein
MSEVDQLDDAGHTTAPVMDELRCPNCDYDLSFWLARQREPDAKVIAALRNAVAAAIDRFEGCGMRYGADEIRKLCGDAIEQTVGETK